MRLLITMLIAITMFTGLLEARRGSSRSSSSRSSFSSSKKTGSSWGSKKKAYVSPTKKKAYVSPTKSYGSNKKITKSAVKKSNFSVQKDAKQQKRMKLNKKYAQKDKAAKAKYKDKKAATKTYKSDLAKKNNYTSSTPPKERPKHIPSTVKTSTGKTVNVTYNNYGSGGYGYGYYNSTGLFVQLAATAMIVDAMQMRHAGYGHWDRQPYVAPRVVHHQPVHSESSNTGIIVLLIVVCVILIVALGIKFS